MSSRVTTTRTTAVVTAILASGALAAGCSSLSGGDSAGPSLSAGTPTPSSASTPSPSTGSGMPSTPAPTSTGASDGTGAKACPTSVLKVALAKGTAGAGNHYQALRLTNEGSSTCVLKGWPGVSYVAEPKGEPVGKPASRAGQPTGPITLRPGDVAHATIDQVQVHNYDPATCDLTPVKGLRVYPPNDTESQFVRLDDAHACAGTGIPGDQLTVTAVQPGAGGR